MNHQYTNHRRQLAALIVAAALLTPTMSAMAADASAVPPTQTQNGVTYVTGGVGQPESPSR